MHISLKNYFFIQMFNVMGIELYILTLITIYCSASQLGRILFFREHLVMYGNILNTIVKWVTNQNTRFSFGQDAKVFFFPGSYPDAGTRIPAREHIFILKLLSINSH